MRVQVDPSFTEGTILNTAEISFMAAFPGGASISDIDSQADTDPDNDAGGPATDNLINNENGDEDDHDRALIEVVQEVIVDGYLEIENECTCNGDGTVTETIVLYSDVLDANWELVQNDGLLDSLGRRVTFIGSDNGEYKYELEVTYNTNTSCLLYTAPSPRDKRQSRMPSSA